MLHRSDSLDRFGDRRQREPSPQRPVMRSDFVTHYDSYRPSPTFHATPTFHAVRDFGSFSRTADTYRPQYPDDTWPSSYSGDGIGHQRKSSLHDRTDERPGSSISSTPPRPPASPPQSQPRSPSSPLAETEVGRTNSRRFSIADNGHQSPSPSLSHSRGSSIFPEGPATKSESRSWSRSPKRSRSGISELDDEFTLPQLSTQSVQEKALPCVTNEVPLLGGDGGVLLQNSRGLGMVVHGSAEKQLSGHETACMNGNFAARQKALEPPFLVPELVPSRDTMPLRGTYTLRVRGNDVDHASQIRLMKS